VFWVGLPAQRNNRVSSDTAYLNDLYRQRAEKAGIVYVDIWDGFVDEGGRYTTQGPDYEGQIRRLRSSDGVYFTKAGARKLAHYVEREIQRSMASRAVPVALPVAPAVPAPSRSGGSTSRPVAGPVLPLTVSTGGGDELLGADRAPRLPGPDPVASRVLVKGEPISAPAGRADDFSWPRGSRSDAAASEPAPDAVATPAGAPGRGKSTSQSRRSATSTAQNSNAEVKEDAPPARKKSRRSSSGARPPLMINPSTWFR
jgi:hypothetical protein